MHMTIDVKPKFHLGRKKVTTDATPEVPFTLPPIIDIDAAEAAAERLGKKIVIGAAAVAVVTIAASTLGHLAVLAFDHQLNK